jgi:glutamate dehydrogenase (NADP+)
MQRSQEVVNNVIEKLRVKSSNEPEFLQAAIEVLESLVPVLEKHPEYMDAGIVERIVEPERIIMFRVTWVDDSGEV